MKGRRGGDKETDRQTESEKDPKDTDPRVVVIAVNEWWRAEVLVPQEPIACATLSPAALASSKMSGGEDLPSAL